MTEETQDPNKTKARAMKAQVSVAREFQMICEMWLGEEPKYTTFCEKVIASRHVRDGLYRSALDKIQDPTARQLFGYFVDVGASMSKSAGGEEQKGAAALPVHISSYISKVHAQVQGYDSAAANLRTQLEEAQEEITRLAPYEQKYVELAGELDADTESELEKLLEEHGRA